jgi:hypothetical protein
MYVLKTKRWSLHCSYCGIPGITQNLMNFTIALGIDLERVGIQAEQLFGGSG